MACSNCSCKDVEPTTGEVNRPVTGSEVSDLRSDIDIIQKQIVAITTFLQDHHADDFYNRFSGGKHTLFSWYVERQENRQYEDDLIAKIKYLNNHGYTVLKK
jgi:hypothetical protein